MANLRADPPDAIDSGSYDLSSVSTYTSDLPRLVLGVAMVLIVITLGSGVFQTIRGPLRNLPVVRSLMAAGDGSGGAWGGV